MTNPCVVQRVLAEWRDMPSTSSRLLLILLTVTIYFTVTPVRADIGIEAQKVALPKATLQGLQARLAPVDSGIGLSLSATSIDLPALGWRRLGMRLLGNFTLDTAQRWHFDGRIKLTGAPGAAVSDASIRLVVDPAANTLQADIEQGKARLQGALPLDQPSHVQLNLDGLPASWLQGLLSTMWSGRVSAGTVSADMALDLREEGMQASGQFTLSDGNFDTPGGAMAGQGLTFSGRLGVDSRMAESQINLDGNLHGGELLLGPMVAHLPGHQVQLAVDASSKSGALELRRLRVGDADALQLDGALAFDAKGALKRVRFDRLQAQFPAAYQRTWARTGCAASPSIPITSIWPTARDDWRSMACTAASTGRPSATAHRPRWAGAACMFIKSPTVPPRRAGKATPASWACSRR
jgi:hypothetical protein